MAVGPSSLPGNGTGGHAGAALPSRKTGPGRLKVYIGFAPGVCQKLEAQISVLLREAVGPNHSLALSAPPNLLESL